MREGVLGRRIVCIGFRMFKIIFECSFMIFILFRRNSILNIFFFMLIEIVSYGFISIMIFFFICFIELFRILGLFLWEKVIGFFLYLVGSIFFIYSRKFV